MSFGTCGRYRCARLCRKSAVLRIRHPVRLRNARTRLRSGRGLPPLLLRRCSTASDGKGVPTRAGFGRRGRLQPPCHGLAHRRVPRCVDRRTVLHCPPVPSPPTQGLATEPRLLRDAAGGDGGNEPGYRRTATRPIAVDPRRSGTQQRQGDAAQQAAAESGTYRRHRNRGGHRRRRGVDRLRRPPARAVSRSSLLGRGRRHQRRPGDRTRRPNALCLRLRRRISPLGDRPDPGLRRGLVCRPPSFSLQRRLQAERSRWHAPLPAGGHRRRVPADRAGQRLVEQQRGGGTARRRSSSSAWPW